MPLILVILALTPASGLSSPEITLYPVADSYTISTEPAANYGTNLVLNLGRGPGYCVWRIYAQFDLTGVQGTAAHAEVRFYEFSTGFAAGGESCELFRVMAPWTSATIAWANQPPDNPQVFDTKEVGDSFGRGWIAWDATELVNQWLHGEQANQGIVLREPDERAGGAYRYGFFFSSEYDVAELRPRLVLTMADATPALPMTWGRLKALYR